ncbi:MAG: preprotein translocase subunit SecA [Candidatus Kerfeldbacteria bacterium]|nr:preprotein translocase subunit SecA [Candidatus Kerfeldbacteria bacterium]
MNKTIEKLFGDRNKRLIKALQKDVDWINGLEAKMQPLSDEQLQAKTVEFRQRLAEGKTLEDIKHEAFAVIREAARRTLGQRHYDVQLMGGLVLHQGNIAEMRTGEGKTLSATTAAYLNALNGKGVHIVTVNDYLARRDADWMGQVYAFMGLTVGCIQHDASYVYDADIEKVRREREEKASLIAGEKTDTNSTEGQGYEALVVADMAHLREVERREAYAADITFGTNNEFGFDYLRDNMVSSSTDRRQRELSFCIIDEVDSILIDEARTPLIISAPAAEATQQYYQFADIVARLEPDNDFTVDEKMHASTLTEQGVAKVEQALGVGNMYAESDLRTIHHIEQALKARTLYNKDKDYVVKDGDIIIIDEFTGRMMQGRRYSEGLHQAIEAKERVDIKRESRTLATITLQNFFRLYTKRSGMTGTAETESEEFHKIYGLDVIVIPTHRENIRADFSDRVYKNLNGKYRAVIARVKELHEKGQPVLLGTISIEHNEVLSQLLTANGIPHHVLNAKQHQQEAEIIAQAGRVGAVTVATNMAGRGVDILLGGNPVDIDEARRVRELGGLAVIGTERHEARRIDNQLRGRSARQGDPGLSQFFVSMDDDVMRIFGSDRMKNFMDRLGMPEDMPIENRMVSRSIESAQRKVESRNFDIRKHLVEYDDVMNKHRDVIYRRRNAVLDSTPEELQATILEYINAEIEHVVSFHTMQETESGEWDIEKICDVMKTIFQLENPSECVATVRALRQPAHEEGKLEDAVARTKIIDFFWEQAQRAYRAIIDELNNPEAVYQAQKGFALRAMDLLWIEHLDQMSFLRDSIGLRGYGQRDPLVEYKRESYQLFQELLANIQKQIVYSIFKLRGAQVVQRSAQIAQPKQEEQHEYHAPAKEMTAQKSAETKKNTQPFVSHEQKNASGEKIGRNDPCPCGSGKKYKKCHGQ